MARVTCPKCHGNGDVPGHLQPNTVGTPRGMGTVRCNQCGGSGTIYAADGPGGESGGGGGIDFAGGLSKAAMWIFGIFFALVFANVPIFGLNWFVSGIIGLCIGAALGGFLAATRIGRYVLLALGLAFIGLVIFAMATN